MAIGAPPDEARHDHIVCHAARFPEGDDHIPSGPAIVELEARRREGAAYLLVQPAAFAFLAERPELKAHVEERYGPLVNDDSCRVFDLRVPRVAAFLDAVLPTSEAVVVVAMRGAVRLGDRRCHRLGATALDRVELCRRIEHLAQEGVGFLVLVEEAPWGPSEPGIADLLEQRHVKVASRPGVCDLFDIRERSDG